MHTAKIAVRGQEYEVKVSRKGRYQVYQNGELIGFCMAANPVAAVIAVI